MPLAVFPQSGGAAGVAETLAAMSRLATASMLDPLIRDQAAFAISGCQRGDRHCQCYALMSWVSRNVRYVPDPLDTEALHDPRLMARGIASKKYVYGDCDDMSTYLAALLKAIGLRPSFRAVGYDGQPFQHVYVRCEGLNLDATRLASMVTFRPNQETSVMERWA